MSLEVTVQNSTVRSFVGRSREVVELSSSLDDAIAGRGRLFLISGEPGIGKTWLGDEVARHAAERGMRVAWGRCWEGGGAPAYWPWVQVVRSLLVHPDRTRARPPLVTPEIGQLVPELSSETNRPTPSDPDQARFRLFDGVATMLKDAARSQPLVLIFDDLHEADQASLEMLKFVTRGLRDSQIVVIGNYRDTEVRRSQTLSNAIAELLREGDQIPLAGLAETEVAQMVEARAALVPSASFVAELYRTTAGNPLFVDGVVRVLMAEGKLASADRLDLSGFKLPEGSRGAIHKRLAMLPADAQVLLVVAAVIGQEFESGLLERVSSLPREKLSDLIGEAAAAGIIVSLDGSRHRFTHPMIREALYNETAAAERIALHRRIGEALEEIYASDLSPHLAELAHHYRQSRDLDKAIDYSVRAGKAAYAFFAYEEVVLHWEAAAALQKEQGADSTERARLLEDLGAAQLLGLEERGVGYLKQALELYEGLGQVEAASRLHVKIGHSLITLNDPVLRGCPLALSHFRSAETLLGENQDFRLRCSLYLGLSAVASELCQGDQAFEASRRALEIGVQSGDELLWVWGAFAHAGSLYDAGDLAKAFELLRQAWQKADELNSTSAAAMAAASASYCHAHLWNPPEGEEWALRELSRSRLKHAPSLRRRLFHNLAHACVFGGKLDEARRHLTETPCLLAEANVAFYAGDWSQAESTLLRDLEQQGRRAGRRKQEGFAMLWLGRLHHARSEYSKAENLLSRALAIVQGQHLYTEIDIRSELTVLYVDSARAIEAQSHLARLREIINAGENWCGLAGHVARAEAAVALAEGRFQNAQGHFEAALEISRRFQVPWDEAEALHRWGRALDAAGEHQRALEMFDAAIEIYERHHGGRCWIDRLLSDRATAVEAIAVLANVDLGKGQCTFRREGEYWTLAYECRTSRLKDAKGLHYIARLLQCPGEQVSAIDLAAFASGGDPDAHRTIDLGDAGEVLDAKARADYKRRLDELREEIERSRRMNDIIATEKAEAEYEALSQHLIAAAGFGGHTRRTASHRERARVAVTKSIKTAIESIRACDSALGRHLGSSIRTGHYCCYECPEATRWHF